jgi:transketolase N-terminal domain/subunit
MTDSTPIDPARYPRLSRIDTPADLRQFDEAELPAIAEELRAYLIESVGKSGGHFGAGLGVIELTTALHYLYDTPEDRIVWDVGHQSYPHKILTGRRDSIHTVKQKNGVAPFPKREESQYDTFGVGHSSTSISAALGMAIANQRAGNERKVVAVIGDGAMTAGMAFEALNHAGGMEPEPNILVILNDNRMSISENVGGLTKMLGRMTGSRTLNAIREGGTKLLGDADVEIALRVFPGETHQPRALAHRRGDRVQARILRGHVAQPLAEHVGVGQLAGGLLARHAGLGVERADRVVLDLCLLGRRVALALGGDHVQQLRAGQVLHRAQRLQQLRHVVAVDRAGVVEAQFLEQGGRHEHALGMFFPALEEAAHE